TRPAGPGRRRRGAVRPDPERPAPPGASGPTRSVRPRTRDGTTLIPSGLRRYDGSAEAYGARAEGRRGPGRRTFVGRARAAPEPAYTNVRVTLSTTRGSSQSTPGTRRGEVFQIGEVALRVTLSLRTVRYYEEAGLLMPIGRTVGGFRLYDHNAIDRLLLIK